MQPSRSYQPMTDDSDDDSDDGFSLTSSARTFHKYSSTTPTVDNDDDDDDDDDDCDNWEDRCVAASSAVHGDGDRASASKLPSQYIKQEQQESDEQSANIDSVIPKFEDKQLAGFCAAVDSQPDVSAAMQSSEMDTGTNVPGAAGGIVSSESSDDSDNDEMPTDSWQQLPGNQGVCELKVEGIDDVSDFISEIERQPAAPAVAASTSKYNVVTDIIIIIIIRHAPCQCVAPLATNSH